MNLTKYKMTTFFYMNFFVLLSGIKGIGLDNNDISFVLIALFSGVFLLIQILYEKYTYRELGLVILCISLGLIIYASSKKITLLMSIIAIVFAKNIPFEKLMKNVFIVKLIGFISIILLTSLGFIENVKQYRIDDLGKTTIRYSLGFAHPNTTYLYFFVLVILFIYIHYDKIELKHYILLLTLGYLMYMITDSRTGYYNLIISLFITYILKNKKIMKNKFVKVLLSLSPIILSIGILVCSIYYSQSNSILNRLNQLLSGRIELSNKFLNIYGIKLFGQQIVEGSDLNGSYLRIDSGYISLLLTCGVIAFVFYIILHVKILKIYLYNQKYKEVLFLLSFLVYGLTEVYIYNVFINASLVFFSDLLYKKNKNNLGNFMESVS